jgi:hypothetical protein
MKRVTIPDYRGAGGINDPAARLRNLQHETRNGRATGEVGDA